MKIAAEIRFKHGELFEVKEDMGWSIRQMADACGVDINLMGGQLRPVGGG